MCTHGTSLLLLKGIYLLWLALSAHSIYHMYIYILYIFFLIKYLQSYIDKYTNKHTLTRVSSETCCCYCGANILLWQTVACVNGNFRWDVIVFVAIFAKNKKIFYTRAYPYILSYLFYLILLYNFWSILFFLSLFYATLTNEHYTTVADTSQGKNKY